MKSFIQITFYIVSLIILLPKTLGNKRKREKFSKEFYDLIKLLDIKLKALGITDIVILKLNICFAIVMIVIYGFLGSFLAYIKYQSILMGLIPLTLMILLGLNFMMKSIDLFNSLFMNKSF